MVNSLWCWPRQRGVTLIEAVLYISVALALIIGGLVFYQQASTASKTSQFARQLSAMLAETRIMINEQPLATVMTAPAPLGEQNITSLLIAAGAAPPDMVKDALTLINPFGGNTMVQAYTLGPVRVITIITWEIPKTACVRLLTANSSTAIPYGGQSATTMVADGYIFGGASYPGDSVYSVNFEMNAKQAAVNCKFGSEAHIAAGIDGTPATPPGTGNPNMTMSFLATP